MRKLMSTLLALLALTSCTKKPETKTFWIYTSLYNNVIQDLQPKLEKKFPGVEFKFYQSGSENVAARVNTELLGGKTQADLVMTSDPYWYEELKVAGKLLQYASPAAEKLPSNLKDPENYYATVRMPVMVLAYHSDAYSEADAPKGFADLAQPKYKDKIAMPNPLESGTAFTTVSILSRHPALGWDYFSKLRENNAISAGGNSAVMARVESKERPVGIVLLENVLATRKKNPKIVPVYPVEGAVLIPSPVAILASTPHPELAKQVYDFMFSKEGQESVVKGDMYGVTSDAPQPEGARTYTQVLESAMPWSPVVLKDVFTRRAEIKQQFSKLMLE